MRRITLLLMVMATALLAVSGVAWAVSSVLKTCPPEPKVCAGTNGADTLLSTSQNNDMAGKGGSDTYTNFVRGNSGQDTILDTAGTDKLVLTNYSQSEVKGYTQDTNKNGKADSVGLVLGPGNKNTVLILGYYDDTSSKPPFRNGPGFIEDIQLKK